MTFRRFVHLFKASLVATLLLAPSATLAATSSNVDSCPSETCGGRKIAIVIDSSGSMLDTDPTDLRIQAAQKIVNGLVGGGGNTQGQSDKVAIIDFDDTARVIYPLGDPSQDANNAISGIDSDGGTYIADGIKKALDQIQSQTQDQTSGKSGVVLLTDGQDSFIKDLLTELGDSQALGVRVNYGYLDPFGSGGTSYMSTDEKNVFKAIIATGGIYSTINSALAMQNFVNMVFEHGLTTQDNPNPNGTSALQPGLTVARLISAQNPVKFTYRALAGEILAFTFQSLDDQALQCSYTGGKDTQAASTDYMGNAVLRYKASKDITMELSITTNSVDDGLFTVTVGTNMLNATRTGSATKTSAPAVPTFVVLFISFLCMVLSGTLTLG